MAESARKLTVVLCSVAPETITVVGIDRIKVGQLLLHILLFPKFFYSNSIHLTSKHEVSNQPEDRFRYHG